MYIKICPICGTEFETINSRYKYCSDKCRKVVMDKLNKEHAKIYYNSDNGLRKRRAYYKAHYQPVKKYCLECGKQLEDGRQTWCLDCLLKDYAETASPLAYKRLLCRGYDKELIMEEINSKRLRLQSL